MTKGMNESVFAAKIIILRKRYKTTFFMVPRPYVQCDLRHHGNDVRPIGVWRSDLLWKHWGPNWCQAEGLFRDLKSAPMTTQFHLLLQRPCNGKSFIVSSNCQVAKTNIPPRRSETIKDWYHIIIITPLTLNRHPPNVVDPIRRGWHRKNWFDFCVKETIDPWHIVCVPCNVVPNVSNATLWELVLAFSTNKWQ